MKHPEKQYLDMIREVLKNGTRKVDRTGTGTVSMFGTMMKYPLGDNMFPLLTTKKVFYRGVVEELLFFLKGDTDANVLSGKGVRIWDKHGSEEYLRSIGIDREGGDLGPVYGFQWRHFGAEYDTCHSSYEGKGVDQLMDVIETIRRDPSNRRLVVSAWNPNAIPKMALPPCHLMFQFIVEDGRLSCAMYQRSGDIGLGVPFNIASYSLLTIIVAHLTGLHPGEFVHFIGDCHVYLNHVDALRTQLEREPRPFPKLFLRPKGERFRPEDFVYEDFELEGYDPYPPIRIEMSV